MKRLFLLILLILSFTPSQAAELLLTAGATYNQLNILGQDKVPTYRGAGGYGELDYLIPFGESSALSLFGIFQKASLDNTANRAEQTEVVDINYMGGGLKLWLGKTFLSASLGRLTFKDIAKGNSEVEIESKERAYEVGIGHRIKLGQHFGIILSFHALNATLHPENGTGFESEYGIWNYRVGFALNFVLPSMPVDEDF
jgi:hypothetical protein